MSDVRKLNELKRKLSESENLSLVLCKRLVDTCENIFEIAESYIQTVIIELDKLENIETSYDMMLHDLTHTYKILNEFYFCPCLTDYINSCFKFNKNDCKKIIKKFSRERLTYQTDISSNNHI